MTIRVWVLFFLENIFNCKNSFFFCLFWQQFSNDGEFSCLSHTDTCRLLYLYKLLNWFIAYPNLKSNRSLCIDLSESNILKPEVRGQFNNKNENGMAKTIFLF